MEAAKFEWLITDLEMMFGPIATDEKQRNWKVERYYEALGNEHESLLKKAFKHVTENHKYKRFPWIGEINEALEMISAESRATEDDDPFPCIKCDGYGVKIVETGDMMNPTAIFCECAKGKIYQKAQVNWKKIMRR